MPDMLQWKMKVPAEKYQNDDVFSNIYPFLFLLIKIELNMLSSTHQNFWLTKSLIIIGFPLVSTEIATIKLKKKIPLWPSVQYTNHNPKKDIWGVVLMYVSASAWVLTSLALYQPWFHFFYSFHFTIPSLILLLPSSYCRAIVLSQMTCSTCITWEE